MQHSGKEQPLHRPRFDSRNGREEWRCNTPIREDLSPHAARILPTQQERHAPSSKDVVILVGKSRRAYSVSAESLRRGSSYFRAWLEQCDRGEGGGGDSWTTAVDCEERIFEHMLRVMRYGTLPTDLPPPDMVKLRTELHLYGIRYHASPSACPSLPDSPSSCSSLGSQGPPPSSSSLSSSNPASPTTSGVSFAAGRTPRPASGRIHRSYHARCPSRLSKLPAFPPELANPAKLVLVSCLPDTMNDDAICHFCCSHGSRRSSTFPNQWALNFAQRHAFCTGCGRPPLHMPAKLFAEMFMAAASYYVSGESPRDEDAPVSKQSSPSVAMAMMSSSKKWVVCCDSTCTLRFVEGPGCQRCATSPRTPASCWSPEEESGLWATSAYFGHAFCASCGEAATGPALLSLLLPLRYGKVRSTPSP